MQNSFFFKEGDKNLSEKSREDVVGGPSIVFTRKADVDETLNRKSTNICKSIVENDASLLNPYSMCQPTYVQRSLYALRY